MQVMSIVLKTVKQHLQDRNLNKQKLSARPDLQFRQN